MLNLLKRILKTKIDEMQMRWMGEKAAADGSKRRKQPEQLKNYNKQICVAECTVS